MKEENWRSSGLADAHLDALLRLAFQYENALMAEEADEAADAEPLEAQEEVQARALFEKARGVREVERRRERRTARFKTGRRYAQKVVNVLACVVLVIALAAPLAVAKVDPLRSLVLKMFVEDHGIFSTIMFGTDDGNESPPVPDEWQGLYFPTYMPETLYLQDWCFELPVCFVDYRSSNGLSVIFQELPNTGIMNLDTEDCITWYEDINGHQAFISYFISPDKEHFEDVITVVWEAEGKMLVVYSNDKDLALKVARSVQQVVR